MTTYGRGTAAVFFMIAFALSVTASPLPGSDAGFGSQTRSQNYDALLDALYANGNVTTTINDKLWVPWYSSSTSCTLANLHSGSNCNSGQTIDATHNCMVTDEFSQVGVLLAMGDDQARFDQFYNTVIAISSTYGSLPGWRVYRDGTTIEACRSGINGNCDTASDADARIMIALFTASENDLFANAASKANYRTLAETLAQDFLTYEVDQTCRQSSLGYGQICYWLAAGSGAKSGGLGSTDYGYTGYYGDAIIAMLQACALTGDNAYCAVAGNFTLNYLQAAKWDGSTFTVPPGRSFKWVNTSGVPSASCTNTCSPDQWDSADAPRAIGMCQANYYAGQIGVTLPGLQAYCNAWGNRYMNSTSSVVIQYAASGAAAGSAQSGYFAQGLEALFQMGGHNTALFEATLDSALSHYGTSTQTWDYTACFGVYNQAFAVRALGTGIGRDEASFPAISAPAPVTNISFSSTSPADSLSIAEPSNQSFSYVLSNPDGLSTTTSWRLNGVVQSGTGSSFTFRGNYSAAGVWNVTVRVVSSQNTVSHTWLLTVTDTAQPSPTNISFSSTSPADSLSIAEPSNQSFSYVLSNPDGLSTTTSWRLNGVVQSGTGSSFTFRGNYSAAGVWNVTVRVVSSQNTVSHTWLLTVTDTAQPSPANISFSSTSPVDSTTIAEPDDATFSYVLSNPDALSATAAWYLNGTGVGAGSSYVFVGGYDAQGVYNVTVVVASSQNTIRHEWTLDVTDTVETVVAAAGGGGGGGGSDNVPVQNAQGAATAVPAAEDPDIQGVVHSFFAGDTGMDAVALVDALREYFAEEAS